MRTRNLLCSTVTAGPQLGPKHRLPCSQESASGWGKSFQLQGALSPSPLS